MHGHIGMCEEWRLCLEIDGCDLELRRRWPLHVPILVPPTNKPTLPKPSLVLLEWWWAWPAPRERWPGGRPVSESGKMDRAGRTTRWWCHHHGGPYPWGPPPALLDSCLLPDRTPVKWKGGGFCLLISIWTRGRAAFSKPHKCVSIKLIIKGGLQIGDSPWNETLKQGWGE